MESRQVEMCWCLVAVGIVLLLLIHMICDMLWVKTKRIRSTLSKQGITGPRPSFFYGNFKEMQKIESTFRKPSPPDADGIPVSHHRWLQSTFPYLQTWTRHYGPMYMFSAGRQQHLYVHQPELIKELKLHRSLDLGKPSYLSKALEPMLGNGIIKANGRQWANQRKLIAPEFFLHKVKGMMGVMEECTVAMIRRWESRLMESEGGVAELIVDQEVRSLSADIISRACFGSSYSQGRSIFAKLRAMQEAMSKPSLLFGDPNFSILPKFLPTKSNKEIWRLKKEVEALILKVVTDRQEESKNNGKCGNDLLEMLLESATTDSELQQHTQKRNGFIVDNCKNIYFAGYESTALATSWTLMLLALYPEWQERVRAEIIEILGDCLHLRSPELDTLRQLKSLTMVIQESLRLYAPSVIVAREAFADIKLGDFVLPKGVHIWNLIPALHRDPDYWGPDANEFKPERFAGGISEACKHPQVYLPFGYGTRICVGQTFAMLELKVIISLLLSRFSFALSPKYCHSPVYKMLLMPEHGMKLLVKGL